MRQILRIAMSLALTAVVLLSALAMQGCSDKDVKSALGDVVSSAKGVVRAMEAVTPAGDPRLAKLEHFLDIAQKFNDDFAAALTPEAELALLPTLTAIIDTFEADVLPLLHVNVNVGIAVAGIDAGLRIVSNHFKNSLQKPAVVSMSRHGAASNTIGAARSRINEYLATPKVEKPKQ
jgi:hypothetical protein